MDSFVTLNKIQTHLLSWGDPFQCNGNDVIICITGNPGIPHFYTVFGSKLHENTKLAVCVVGHAGHEVVPDEQSNELEGQEHLFNLDGQIQHKLDLITEYIDKDSKIHLIGHSIGAWLLLEVLEKHEKIRNRVLSVNLLFPTVQKMAETKGGRIINYIRKVHKLLMFFLMVLYLIPESNKGFLANIAMKVMRIPQYFKNSLIKLFHPKVIENILFLAYNEMDNVKVLNVNSIEKIKDRTNVLYGATDHWVPLHYMEDMRRFQPEISLTKVDVEHGFVLRSSEIIAESVSHFVKNRISQKTVPETASR